MATVTWHGTERKGIAGVDQWWPGESREIDDPAEVAGYRGIEGFTVRDAMEGVQVAPLAPMPAEAAAPAAEQLGETLPAMPDEAPSPEEQPSRPDGREGESG